MTFWCAQERARAADGELILRVEDLDPQRCRKEFRDAVVEDLKWFGLGWAEGPDLGGPFSPYLQSERRALHLTAWQRLLDAGRIYPCSCSRKDVLGAAVAPHDENEEPIYPGTCRPQSGLKHLPSNPAGMHWRFRVPDGEELRFVDLRLGERTAISGTDLGDFVVWRKDDVPAYHLAVTVDDAAMGITEVVRGEDLLRSIFRHLLLYRALGEKIPKFYHSPLVTDESGKRLAKRDDALSLRALRATGVTPEEIRARFCSDGL
jgi:glutamyl-tRNA synthetase